MLRMPERSPTILVVDDDDAVRRVMVRFLSRSGFEVLEAADALLAQDVVRSWKGHIDLLVTDVMMPRVKGTELAKWLCGDRPDVAVLLVSGYVDSEMLQSWVDRGSGRVPGQAVRAGGSAGAGEAAADSAERGKARSGDAPALLLGAVPAFGFWKSVVLAPCTTPHRSESPSAVSDAPRKR